MNEGMSVNRSVLLVMLLLYCLQVFASIKLPGIISDHMVLQRDKPIRFWGWATPGSVITLRFKGKTYPCTTADGGKWLVKLPASPAGGPYELELEGDSSLIRIHDILVGDVWVASGQSNMEYGIQTDRDGKETIAQATDSMIRMFFVPWVTSLTEKNNTATATGLNGHWVVCSPKSMAESWAWHGFSAVGFYFAQLIRKNYPKLPLGMIGAYKGGTPAQAWVSISGLEQEKALHHYVAEHKKIVNTYIQSDTTGGKKPDGGFGAPGNLFNGMIAPLIHFPIKGVIWYQGESNGDNLEEALEYRVLFPRLIKDWRQHWQQRNFPFLFVQLTSFRAPAKEPVEGIWPWVREAQLKALSLPNTGMAVITDAGDATDIHPKSKKAAGTRLALAALKVVYNKKGVSSGPLYTSMRIKGNSIELNFSNTGGGLIAMPNGSSEQTLSGFAIAGKSKHFMWANAVLQGNKVIVSAEGLNEPVAVRYNWADNPPGNLYNKEGLPASPFRTDNWDANGKK